LDSTFESRRRRIQVRLQS